MFRHSYIQQIHDSYEITPVCALLGPRQSGKTTIAKQYIDNIKTKVHFFDLEDPDHLSALQNPKLTFEFLDGLIVIDEIQRIPELFQIIRVMVDHYDKRFLILGSASQTLIRQSSETLAGRISYIEVTPFSFTEVGEERKLWWRGGFPRAFLAKTDTNVTSWHKSYIRTFLEKDIPSFGFDINPLLIQKFWLMLASIHGNIFNASELGRSLDLNHKTTKRYLDILDATFMVRSLQPWFENISKRQVKSPKIYFRDTGILHTLLGIKSYNELLLHYKIGSSWEGFAMEEIIRFYRAGHGECFFWATHSGGELDLLINLPGQRKGFEFKYSNSPSVTKSMHDALNYLKLDEITIIVPGEHNYRLTQQVRVVGLSTYVTKISESSMT